MRSQLLALLVVTSACSGKSTPPPPTLPPLAGSPVQTATPPAPPAPAQTFATLNATGIVGEWIDRKTDPCTDFYQFSCGGFLATAQIPADRSAWGTIQIVTKESEDFLHDVLEKAAAAKQPDPISAKLGAYYAACMDEKAIETAGIAPIRPLLDTIATVKDSKSAAAAIVALHGAAVFPYFGIGPQQDFADATKVIASLDQSGLGLPDRKYYLENTGSLPKTRVAYQAHLVRMFKLLAASDKTLSVAAPAAAAKDVMRIETAIAKVQQDEVTRRDPHKVYNRVDRDGLVAKVAPKFPWVAYFTALGIPTVTAISVNDAAYFSAIDAMIAVEKPGAQRNYLTWMVMHSEATRLGKAWVDEDFTLDKELSGVQAVSPRWRRCVNRTDDDLGELLAQSYVAARFAGSSKPRAIELTKAVLGAMRVELDALPWMDAPTRAAAKTKLDKMAYLVGFPEAWRTYDFDVVRTDFASNVRAATRFELARQLGKIGKPVDRKDWQMTPPTVNAYYDPTLNEIALPAGQLQAPFFGETFHPAVNFGSTGGGTIGHEMTHGFDDEGSQFDGEGNLRDWWSASTKENFSTATTCIVDQYAQYEAVPNVKLDGKLTAGENIADNGGVKLAFQAYQSWKAAQKTPPPTKIGAYTDDQLYFLAYGQSWCDKMTPQALETMAHANPHSPPKWRVNGVIVNQPGFATAFSCKTGSAMNPGKQCAVW
ncbi:MAG: M13 family metallopeptidase [Polyangiales bacterium]